MFLAAFLLALPLQALAEGAVPKPKLRPAQAKEGASEAAIIPIPKLRPSQKPAPIPETPPAAAEEEKPEVEEPPTPPSRNGSWSADEVAAARRECQTLLQGIEIEYKPLDPIGRSGGCGAPAPVAVTRVAGVALSPPATLTCPMAAALHNWITEAVQPAARKRLRTEVTEIRAATSYACRRRNNSSSGKMSEHARANALDMAGFSFSTEGKNVAVGGSNWGEGLLASLGLSRGGSFLNEIRAAACPRFTTVLGPGSDPYHGDHFHVDVLKRKGGYRICQ